MPQCAGCGKRVCPDEPRITLNKVWHKCCFRCYKCGCDLNADFARVYKGEIYCHSCFKIFRKYCSFDGEDEGVDLEEHGEPYTSSSHNYYKTTPMQSDDGFPSRNKTWKSKTASHAIPRELANYFNRNPVGDKRNNSLLTNRSRPCSYPLYQCQTKNKCILRGRKLPVKSASRSSSCLERAARSLSKRREYTDSCESSEKIAKPEVEQKTKAGCQNKMHCDVNQRHKYTGCSICRRCGHKVYAAEIVLTSYGAYHNSCFSCYSCLKPLDATNVEEHCGEIFCRRCYKKHFGFNNYGFRNRL